MSKTYNPKIQALLTQVREEALERGYQCDEPFEMSDDETRWTMLVMPAGSTYDDEDGVDVSITILESEHRDGEENGLNFGLDVVSYGGEIIGGMTPFNYSPQVWVERDNPEAVEERWELFSNAFDASPVVDSIEGHYAR